MKESVIQVLVTTFYLLVIINPISKVSVLSVLSSPEQRRTLRGLTLTSSLVGGAILLGSMVFGDFVLRSLFRVELYSLRLAGGAVLFWVGFNALRKGVFFEKETQHRFEDLALVPLACPMIAGPATIAACITLRARDGLAPTILPVVLAVGLNYLAMRMSASISNALGRFNLLGALVRLTGLIVMTVGTQMTLDGLAVWTSALRTTGS